MYKRQTWVSQAVSIKSTAGTFNTSAGTSALGSSPTGASNTAFGYNTASTVSTGNYNTAFGSNALSGTISYSDSTAVGYQALFQSNANSNTAVGSQALYQNTGGYANTAVGAKALIGNISGNQNTGFGRATLFSSTGSNNIAVGDAAGYYLTTGNYNIAIGHQGVAADNYTIRIGTPYSAATGQNQTFIAGISGVTSTGGAAVFINSSGQLGTLTSSLRFKENIQPMADLSSRIFNLRPVTFSYKAEYGGGGMQYGLIAEEVDQVIPEMTVRDKDGQIETVAYQMLPPMLLNEAQKQQKVIEALQARVEAQQAELDTLKAQMAKVLARLPQ